MSSFLKIEKKSKEKQKARSKSKLFFLPIPEETIPRVIAVIIYALLVYFILSYLWPIAIGTLVTFLAIKFIHAKKIKIISVCIVVAISITTGYFWIQKVSKDRGIRKSHQAIEVSLRAEQKQKEAVQKQQEDELKNEQDIATAVAEAQNEKKIREQTISDLTPVCVSNHKSLYKPKIKELLNGTEAIPQSSTRKGAYTNDECRQIIIGLFNQGYKAEEIGKVAESKYWIGMDAKLLYFSVGLANNYSNTTTTIFGTSSQLVYGDPLYGANYIYVDNGKVSSFQN